MTTDLSTQDIERLGGKFLVDDGCWNWIGNKNQSGYGRFKRSSRYFSAHRVVYELFVGPIPEGLELDHTCSNRGCVRPDHLESVTHRENTLRGSTITARHAAQTHCVNHHEFTPENTAVRTDNGGRRCRACRDISNRKVT